MNYQTLLDTLHEIEQRENRMISRRELNTHFPETMSFADRRLVIQTWQNSYIKRCHNVLRHSLRRK